MERRKLAMASFKRRIIWLGIVGVVMVAGALWYLSLGGGPVSIHVVAAVIFGVFISVVLGGGLMAAGFFSSRGGYDDDATGKIEEKPTKSPTEPTETRP